MPIFVSCFLFIGMLFSTAIIADPWSSGQFKHRDIYPPELHKSERIYFDSEDVPMDKDVFRIRVGGNEWIATETIHRDGTGCFTFVSDIKCAPGSLAYEKHWQCPYCHIFWPENVACQNPRCPSKYR